MIPLDSYVTTIPDFEEGNTLDVATAAWETVFRDPHYLEAGRHSTSIDQADLDSLGVEGPFPAFTTSNMLFDSPESDATLALPDFTQGYNPWIEYGPGSVLVEDPVINSVPCTSNENSWDPVISSLDPPLVSYPTDPGPQALFLGQDVEESFQTNAVSSVFILWDVPHLGWGIGRQETGFSSESPPLLSTDPAVGIDGSSIPGENIQRVNLTVVHSLPSTAFPSVETASMELVHFCEWKEADGTVCGGPFTRATLPEHLPKHGIKNKPRDHPTTCNWVGCKKKKPMNRESIVRHIREIHMHIKRRSKPVQKRCS